MASSEDKEAFLAVVKAGAAALEAEPGDAEDKIVAALCAMGTLAAAGNPQDEQEAREVCAEMRSMLAEHKAAKA